METMAHRMGRFLHGFSTRVTMAGPTCSPRTQNGPSTAEQQLAEEVPMERRWLGLGTPSAPSFFQSSHLIHQQYWSGQSLALEGRVSGD